MTSVSLKSPSSTPILLFDDECGVCRHIARWVKKSAASTSQDYELDVRPIGNDPEVLRSLNPNLDIWDAYATIHVLLPDGSMKVGGEAVAEVFRRLPKTKWFAGIFTTHFFGFRPFQSALNLGYIVLADVRPILGCESCGTPSLWLRPIKWLVTEARALIGVSRPLGTGRRFTGLNSD
jgi:predicted DCC family thiol-disulfide oxidoreductase YuxK